MSADVVLQDTSLQVVPGETLTVSAVVTNTGRVVDAITLSVVGLADGWAVVEPSEVRLLPGRKREVQLVISPPRASATATGLHVLGLRAQCREDPAGSCVEEAALEVLPFVDVTAELVPRSRSVRGRRTASFVVAVDNRGNTPLVVGLDAYDPDQDLVLAVGSSGLDCAPGSATFGSLRARGQSSYWRGPALAKGFLALVTVPGREAPIELPGTLEHKALVPQSLPRVVSRAALLGAGLLAALLILPSALGTQSDDTTRAAAEEAVRPANDTALQAAADADAARRAAEAAQAKVVAEPSTTPSTTPSAAAGAGAPARPYDLRLQVSRTSTGPFIRMPADRLLMLSGFVLQPNGDRGEMALRRNGTPLVTARLGDTEVFDLPAPVLFGPATTVQLTVVCRNPVEDPCDTAVLLTGTLRAVPVTTPTPSPGPFAPNPTPVPEPVPTAEPIFPDPDPAPEPEPAPDPVETTEPPVPPETPAPAPTQTESLPPFTMPSWLRGPR